MTQTIIKTKLRNGAILLPPALANKWRGKDILILPTENRLLIQAVEEDWDEYEHKLKKNKVKISPKLIDEAVRWARNKQ